MTSESPPPGRPAAASLVGELWRHRQYVLTGALYELKRRYAGTGMGLVWHVVIPLVQVVVFLVVFSALLGRPGSDRSISGYAVFLCSGLLPWLVFADCVGRGSLSFLANENYLRKLAIPESVFAAQSVATGGYTLAFYSVILLVLALATGLHPRVSWLLLPAVLVLFLGLCFGITLVLATLTVFFRDLAPAVTILLQIWFWVTPVVYDRTALWPWMERLVAWNPPTAYIVSVRQLLLEGTAPGFGTWIWMAALSLGACALGASVVERLRSDIRDAL